MNTMEKAFKMDSCSHRTLDILRYLDHQLNSEELEAFFAHLKSCNKCRARTEEEQALSGVLRNTRPLYAAPLALRIRVSAVLSRPPARYRILEWLCGRVLPTMRSWRGIAQGAPGWALALSAVLATVLGLTFFPRGPAGQRRQLRFCCRRGSPQLPGRHSFAADPVRLTGRSDGVVFGQASFSFPPAFRPAGSSQRPHLPAYRGEVGNLSQ